MSTALAQTTADSPLASLPHNHKMLEMMAFSEAIKDAIFIPQFARGNPANVFYMVATADAMGANWLHALRSCFLTPDGKIGFQWDLISAVLLAKKFLIKWDETNSTRAIVTITRPDGQSHQETFGVVDAEAIQFWNAKKRPEAGWSKLSDKFNWKSYPKNMCMARAGMNCARAIAADVMGGIYLPDELEGLPPEDAAETAAPVVEDYAVGTTEAPEEAPNTASAAGPVEDKPAPTEPPPPTEQSKPPAAKKAAKATAPAPPVEQAPPPVDPDAPETPEAKAKRIQGELSACAKTLGGGKAGSTVVVEFAKGFLDLAKSPTDMLLWEPILAPLQGYIERNVEALKANPHQCGYGAKHNPPFIAKMKEWGWPDEVHGQVIAFCASSYPGKYDGFTSWMKVIDMTKAQSVEDLKSFFTAAEISKVSAVEMLDAIRLPVCQETGGTYSDLFKMTVSMTKKRIEDLDKVALDEAVKVQVAAITKSNEDFLKQNPEKAEAPAAAALPVEDAPPPATAEEQGGFPFGE